MIEYTEGDLLEAKVDALVNTVNEVGVMGKGIALQFREAFPASGGSLTTAAAREGTARTRRSLLLLTGLRRHRGAVSSIPRRTGHARAR